MADAKRWSQMLWEENKTGPGDDETNVKIPEPVGQQKGKGKKPRSPPPDRATLSESGAKTTGTILTPGQEELTHPGPAVKRTCWSRCGKPHCASFADF